MPLFSRRKDDPATRDPEDFSGGPGIKNYSDEPDSDRLAPDDPRKPDSPTDLGKRTWFGRGAPGAGLRMCSAARSRTGTICAT